MKDNTLYNSGIFPSENDRPYNTKRLEEEMDRLAKENTPRSERLWQEALSLWTHLSCGPSPQEELELMSRDACFESGINYALDD
ncbi:MAG: hypothetical protein Q7S74_06775 [Nanoarchaeota archaeon]|nr:hypothetical protein [Nanoarchaeota archaeon]